MTPSVFSEPSVRSAYDLASRTLADGDWHGLAGEIARTGEEDPLALVDDPDLQEVIAAKMKLRRQQEGEMFNGLEKFEQAFGADLIGLDAMIIADVPNDSLVSLAGDVAEIVRNLHSNTFTKDDTRARLYLLSKFKDILDTVAAT